jgi:hypothetical protein
VSEASEVYLSVTGAPLLGHGQFGKQTRDLVRTHGKVRVLNVWRFACEQFSGDWGRGVLKWAWPENYPEFEAGLDRGVTDPVYDRFAQRIIKKGAA